MKGRCFMQIKSFQDLVRGVQAMPKKSRVAVVAAHDEHTLESIVEATKDGLINPVLIGDKDKIKEILSNMSQSPNDYDILPAADVDECMQKAINMVHSGDADVIMKGKLETASLMKAIINKTNGIGKGRMISLVGFYEMPSYHKLFAVSDMGINTYPDLQGKKDILLNAVELLRSLGNPEPKVAVLSAVEKVNSKMPDTLHGESLKTMQTEDSAFGKCIVEAPISFDLATSKEAADIKGYKSPVAGDADLLLVPDIVSGNILVKCLTGFAGAQTAGLVVGAKVPIVLTSRSAEAKDKYYSIALSAYAAGAFE